MFAHSGAGSGVAMHTGAAPGDGTTQYEFGAVHCWVYQLPRLPRMESVAAHQRMPPATHVAGPLVSEHSSLQPATNARHAMAARTSHPFERPIVKG